MLDNVFATDGNNIVKVFNKMTTCFWTMDTPLFSGHLGAFDALSHLMLALQYLMLCVKIYLQAAQKWLLIRTYIHPPDVYLVWHYFA